MTRPFPLLLILALAAPAFAQASRPAQEAPTLAVLPLRFAPESLEVSGSNLDLVRRELSATAISARLLEEIVATRRFRVLERERSEAILRELNLGSEGLADPKQLPKGKVLPARYLVAGEVRTFRVSVTSHAIPGGGDRRITRVEVEAEVGVRVIDSETSLLVAARPCRYRLRRPLAAAGLSTSLLGEVQRELAARLRAHVVDAIFPIRILRLEGTEFVVDRGQGDVLSKGDRLLVRVKGKAIGVLEVTKVGLLESHTRLVEGRGVAPGDPCERTESGQEGPTPGKRVKPEGW